MPIMPPAFDNPPRPSREPNPRFEEFQRSLERDGIKYYSVKVEKRLDQAFPEIDDQIAYYEWRSSLLRERANRATVACPSPEEYMDRLKNTSYTDYEQVWWLKTVCWLPYRPVIIVGTSGGITYKVSICTRIQGRHVLNDARKQMPDNIMGISDNVEPGLPRLTWRRRRNQNFSEESTESTESDDYNPNAFHIFHQIGSLMYYVGNFKANPEKAMRDEKNWAETGFAVVSDVTPGRARGVWLIFDFYPFDDTGERCHFPNDFDWGYLPELDKFGKPQSDGDQTEEDQFSVAKIADSLSDLGADYEFKFEHKLKHEPEFVRVVKSGEGHLLRQLVDRENASRVMS